VRLVRLMPGRSIAVWTAAALFAVAHFPNPILMAATMLWGMVACRLFLRYRDLYTLGVVHAVLGLTLAFAIPAAIHHQMHVGLGYLRYHPEQSQRGTASFHAVPQVRPSTGVSSE
jgi:membrane protease YdiL (CAAX protease family)